MSIPAIGAVGFTPDGRADRSPSTVGRPASTRPRQAGAAPAPAGADFGNLLSKGLENLQGLHQQADTLGRQGRHR